MSPATGTSRASGFTLGLQFVVAAVQLVVVAFAGVGFEVADASPFGRPGTAIVLAVVTAVAFSGVRVAWRGTGRTVRVIAAGALFAAAGVLPVF